MARALLTVDQTMELVKFISDMEFEMFFEDNCLYIRQFPAGILVLTIPFYVNIHEDK